MHLLGRLGQATTAAEVHAQLLADAPAIRAHLKGTALSSPRSKILAMAMASAWLSSVYLRAACVLLL